MELKLNSKSKFWQKLKMYAGIKYRIAIELFRPKPKNKREAHHGLFSLDFSTGSVKNHFPQVRKKVLKLLIFRKQKRIIKT